MFVFVLKGKHDSGKSTTLKMLHQMMLDNGFRQVPGHYQSQSDGGDWRDVLESNGLIIGIATRGDEGDLLAEDLAALAEAGCEKCFSACRSRGPTLHAIWVYPNRYIYKTIVDDATQEQAANATDAQILFDLI